MTDAEAAEIVKRRQRDCKRHPTANIRTPGSAEQCAFCGMSRADQEAWESEQNAWAQFTSAATPGKVKPGTPAPRP